MGKKGKKLKNKVIFSRFTSTGPIDGSSFDQRFGDVVCLLTVRLIFGWGFKKSLLMQMTDVQKASSINRRNVVHFFRLPLRFIFECCENSFCDVKDGRVERSFNQWIDRSHFPLFNA